MFTSEDNALYQRLTHQDLPAIPTGLTIRKARPDDYDAVMGFSEGVLDGTDYLPALYHEYLAHPTRYLYVAVFNGDVVSIFKRSKLQFGFLLNNVFLLNTVLKIQLGNHISEGDL